jgi:N-acetylglucosaminylphosphatidylinositol deacetylase
METKTLLCIAHPDDEVMFFLPSLKNAKFGTWALLCFSTGNYDGLGSIRVKELEKSCKTLHIEEFEILSDPKLEDGPSNQWDPEYISSLITQYAKKISATQVICEND